jgi:hypothetical protein
VNLLAGAANVSVQFQGPNHAIQTFGLQLLGSYGSEHGGSSRFDDHFLYPFHHSHLDACASLRVFIPEPWSTSNGETSATSEGGTRIILAASDQ